MKNFNVNVKRAMTLLTYLPACDVQQRMIESGVCAQDAAFAVIGAKIMLRDVK